MRPGTPPDHPIFNVGVSVDEIQRLVKQALPDSDLVSSAQLPTNSSYNNRLYFVRVGFGVHSHQPEEIELVLKICGRFWTHFKTLNEVLCLKAIKRSCPSIPVPEVIAWCDDRDVENGIGKEWILMTKMPGEILSSMQLDDTDRRTIMVDLARILSILRTSIESPQQIGNLVQGDSSGSIAVGGLVDQPAATRWPWRSYIDYIRAILGAQIVKLSEMPVYERNKYLLPLLNRFLTEKIQHLRIFHDAEATKPVMTHNDLSSQNILLLRADDDKLVISGLIDWEFSGFFSPFDEYLSMSDELFETGYRPDGNAKVVESSLADMLFNSLEGRGISTPRKGFLNIYWRTAQLLHQLQNNVAPWWLRECSDTSTISVELDSAAALVKEALEELSAPPKSRYKV